MDCAGEFLIPLCVCPILTTSPCSSTSPHVLAATLSVLTATSSVLAAASSILRLRPHASPFAVSTFERVANMVGQAAKGSESIGSAHGWRGMFSISLRTR